MDEADLQTINTGDDHLKAIVQQPIQEYLRQDTARLEPGYKMALPAREAG